MGSTSVLCILNLIDFFCNFRFLGTLFNNIFAFPLIATKDQIKEF